MLETVTPASRESFDETGYLLANPDVAAAVKTGQVKSGWKHFTDIGYSENRRQFRFEQIRQIRERKMARLLPHMMWPEPIHATASGALDCLPPDLAEMVGAVPTNAVSQHDYEPTVKRAVENERDKFFLDAGAGFRPTYYEHVVNLEIAPYTTTDVIGALERMPFADDTFDYVISNAVLEHIRDPFTAAKEITRVLKPGGRMFILVPFLQPYHGYPNHYYNMTKSGLRNLFDGVDVVSHTVPFYFHPVWVMRWFMNSWSLGLTPETKTEFERMTVKDLMEFPVQDMTKPFVKELSEDKQFELASGTFLIAEKAARS
jgi:SAM-dependent methyltransferase